MISGRRHAASIRIAKQYGYHSDYLGQLIRGGKIKGQKVGRAWYVDIESLAAYLGKDVPVAKLIADAAKQQAKEEALVSAPAPEAAAEEVVVAAQEEPVPAAVFAAVEEERTEDPVRVISLKKETQIAAPAEDPAAEEAEEAQSNHVAVAIRVPEEKPETKKKNSGLMYVSEEESLLPQIKKSNRAPQKLDIEVEALAASEPVITEKKEATVRMGYGAQVFALATVGVLVVALVTAGSSLFVYKVSAGPAQTASVQFSVPQ